MYIGINLTLIEIGSPAADVAVRSKPKDQFSSVKEAFIIHSKA
jgi:hypothetical protein